MNNMQFQENIKAIESLIDKGIYNPNFKQPKWAKEFFAESIKKIMTPTMKTILECGVGTGFWIKLLQALYPGHVFYGFDISDKMLQIAKVNLGFSKNILLKKGDILQDESFHFNNISSFDMIFCYDVIQQISNKNYISVIRNMLRHINKNGVVIIFDNEKYSFYGCTMAFKKLITKFCKIPLVPYEFCGVKYPPLNHIKKQIEALGYKSQLYIAQNKIKRALVIYGTQS